MVYIYTLFEGIFYSESVFRIFADNLGFTTKKLSYITHTRVYIFTRWLNTNKVYIIYTHDDTKRARVLNIYGIPAALSLSLTHSLCTHAYTQTHTLFTYTLYRYFVSIIFIIKITFIFLTT